MATRGGRRSESDQGRLMTMHVSIRTPSLNRHLSLHAEPQGFYSSPFPSNIQIERADCGLFIVYIDDFKEFKSRARR